MSGDNLTILGLVALFVIWWLLDELIDAWRERGRRRHDPPPKEPR